jgi:hypothetical protein
VQQVGVAVVGAVALPTEVLLRQLSCCQREDNTLPKVIEAHLKLLLKMLQELQQIVSGLRA